MKRLVLLVSTMILFMNMNYAQRDSFTTKPVNISGIQIFEKGKHQTKAAVILAGSGVVLGTLAVAVFPKDYNIIGTNSAKTENAAGFSTALFITGAALLITSIPYFIVGGINKHKAKLLMKTENISLSPGLNLPARQFKAGISIGL